MPAVPYSLENSYQKVVHDKSQRTAEINAEISYGVWQHFRRSTHQNQNLRSCNDTYKGEGNTTEKAQGNDGMDGTLHQIKFLGTEISCYNNSCTDSKSVEKSNHQKDQIPGGTDSS